MDHRRIGSSPFAENAAGCPHCGAALGRVVAVGWSVGHGDDHISPGGRLESSALDRICEEDACLGFPPWLPVQVCVGDGTDPTGDSALPRPDLGSEGSHAPESGSPGMVAPWVDEDRSCPVCGGVSGEVFLEGIFRAISEGRKNSRKRGPR